MGILEKIQPNKGSNTRVIRLDHDYAFPARLVWNVAIDLGHLKTVTKGLVHFRNLPPGYIFQGQHIQVDVSLFGWMPYQPYEMTVISLDHEEMCFQSTEVGAGVRSWHHSLRVNHREGGCRISEEIEIDAGMATPVFAEWAKFLYRRRHKPRLKILTAHKRDGAKHETSANF